MKREWIVWMVFLVLQGCQAEMSGVDRNSLAGAWTVVSISGQPVVADSGALIEFSGEHVSGSSGCNRFSGGYTLSGTRLEIGQAVSTRMACPEPLMDQEQRFFAALTTVASARLNSGSLELVDADGNTVFVASRTQD